MNAMWKIGDFVEDTEPMPATRPGIWHLAMARGGRERTTAEFLRRHRFEVYFPLTRVMKSVAQRHMSRRQREAGAMVKKAVLRPIFPGYIFVRFDPSDDDFHGFFDAAGVFGLVCANDLPAAVPDEMIAGIRSKEIDGAVPGVVLMRQLFKVGETVRVTSGPFASFHAVVETLPPRLAEQLRTGKLEEIDESDRVSLAVNIFGRSTPVEMSIGDIQKIEPRY